MAIRRYRASRRKRLIERAVFPSLLYRCLDEADDLSKKAASKSGAAGASACSTFHRVDILKALVTTSTELLRSALLLGLSAQPPSSDSRPGDQWLSRRVSRDFRRAVCDALSEEEIEPAGKRLVRLIKKLNRAQEPKQQAQLLSERLLQAFGSAEERGEAAAKSKRRRDRIQKLNPLLPEERRERRELVRLPARGLSTSDALNRWLLDLYQAVRGTRDTSRQAGLMPSKDAARLVYMLALAQLGLPFVSEVASLEATRKRIESEAQKERSRALRKAKRFP